MRSGDTSICVKDTWQKKSIYKIIYNIVLFLYEPLRRCDIYIYTSNRHFLVIGVNNVTYIYYTHIYIYIYVCVCVCVCLCAYV